MPASEQAATLTFATISCIGVLLIALAVIRAVYTFYLLLKASHRLHDKMVSSVVRAKIVFFDTNPVGRILNRFSADVGINDDLLPMTTYDFLVCAFLVLGGIATAIMVLPVVLVALPPLIWYFIRLRKI